MDQKTIANSTKVVQAGMKVLYAPETRQILNQALNADMPNAEALALNVVGVIKILFDKSQGKLPPDVIPVATMMLVYELATFMRDAGREIKPEEVKQAIPIAMDMLKKVFAKQIEAAKGGQQQAPQAPPQPQGGMIQQAQPQMMGA